MLAEEGAVERDAVEAADEAVFHPKFHVVAVAEIE
jgi:hypothetical protein